MSRIVVFGAGFLGERLSREIPGATLSRADITDEAAVLAALQRGRDAQAAASPAAGWDRAFRG